MLEDLKGYENLGTSNFFYELFEILNGRETWAESDVESYFHNRIIDDKRIYDGCLPLLKLLKIVTVDSQGFLAIPFSYREKLNTIESIKRNLIESVIFKLKNDKIFITIFSGNNIEFDYVSNTISIKKNAFGLKYSNLMKLLINLEFFKPHYNSNLVLTVHPDWTDIFIRNFSSRIRKNKTLEQLKKQLEIQSRYGEDAEKFVLEFEGSRLGSSTHVHWIAPFDVGAGYDILSVDNLNNKNKRCIEVKSYIYTPYFYWSTNEVKVAREEGEGYFLYLVNRDKMNDYNYSPLMIQNPYENIFDQGEWERECQNWYFELNPNTL